MCIWCVIKKQTYGTELILLHIKDLSLFSVINFRKIGRNYWLSCLGIGLVKNSSKYSVQIIILL